METNKKLLIVGILAAVGIGLYVWNKKDKEKKTTIAEKSGKLDVKAIIPQLDTKIPVAVKSEIAKTEKKSGVVESVKLVKLIPDRRWLERNWADVS